MQQRSHQRSASCKCARWLAFMSVLTGLAIAPAAQAGRLGGARGSAHGSTRSSGGGGGSRGGGYHGGGYHGGYRGGYGYGYHPYAWWGLRAFGAPWWVPYGAPGETYDRPYAFPSAPYADGADGYVRIQGVTAGVPDPDAAAHPGRVLLGNRTAVRLSADGTWIDSNMQRYGLAMLLSTSDRLEIGTEWWLYRERLQPGDVDLPQGGIDTLVMGTIDGALLFAQTPRAQFRTGLGVRTLVDSAAGNEYGINFLYAMDFYPARPLVVSMRGDVGSVGDAVIARARATVGAMLGQVEVYGGYDKTWMSRADLGGGPVLGVRVWN